MPIDAKLSQERDRLVQSLTGLADALLCASPEQLANILPIAASVDTIVAQVRKVGVQVATEYPEEDSQPIDAALLRGLLAGASILRNN